MVVLEVVHGHHNGNTVCCHKLSSVPATSYNTMVEWDHQDDGACLSRFRDLIKLTDMCLIFDENGILVRYGYVSTLLLEQNLCILKSLEKEVAEVILLQGSQGEVAADVYGAYKWIGRDTDVLVLQLNTKLDRWQRICAEDTVAWRLGIGRVVFALSKRLRVLEVLTCFGAIFYTWSSFKLQLPYFRDESDDWVFSVSNFLVISWYSWNGLLLNYPILLGILRGFRFWYTLLFGLISGLGFLNAFQAHPIVGKFLCTSMAGFSIFITTTDALHPSIRRKHFQASLSILYCAVLLSCVLFTGYWFPENLYQPINKTPIWTWKVGNAGDVSRMHGLTVALDWGVSVLIFTIRYSVNIIRTPNRLSQYRAQVCTRRMNTRELLAYETRLNQRMCRRDTMIRHMDESSMERDQYERQPVTLTRKSFSLSLCLQEGKVEKSDSDDVDVNELSKMLLVSSAAADAGMSFSVKIKKNTTKTRQGRMASSSVMEDGTRGKKTRQLLALQGTFANGAHIIDNRDTIIRVFMGEKIADGYFKFCKITRWFDVASLFILIGYPLSIHYVYNRDFREGNPEYSWVPAVSGWIATTMVFHIVLFMNYPVFRVLLWSFDTYFQLYLVVIGYGASIYMFDDFFAPRSFAMLGALLSHIAFVTFGDAIHPSSRKLLTTRATVCLCFFLHISLLLANLNLSAQLAEPLVSQAIITLNFGGQDNSIEINLLTVSVSKLLLVNIWFAKVMFVQLRSPGQFNCLSATLEFTDTSEVAKQQRSILYNIRRATYTLRGVLTGSAAKSQIHPSQS